MFAKVYYCYIITPSKAKPERSGDAKLEGLIRQPVASQPIAVVLSGKGCFIFNE